MSNTPEAALRTSDPACKRFPDVCGEIAEHHNPNSLVCQLPIGHAGPHFKVAEKQYDPQVAGVSFSTLDVEARERLMRDAVEVAKQPRIEGVPAELLQRGDQVGELYIQWINKPDLQEAIRQAVEQGRVIRIDDRLSLENRRQVERHIARCSAEYHERLAREARQTLRTLE